MNKTSQKSFITSREVFQGKHPDEVVGARLYWTFPLETGEMEEYDVKFRKLKVVPYLQEDPLPHTLGLDFLSICPMITAEGRQFIQMPRLSVMIE